MKVIVGLGNPGKEYEGNRHNVGFMLVDGLAEMAWGNKFGAEMSKVGDTLLVKPQNFMNRSGEVVAKVVNFYKIDLSGLFVVHDDLDIRLGDYKIQFGVGPKVHNGIDSVEKELGNNQFWRVRIGIDNRSQRVSGEKYVLSDFTKEERIVMDGVIAKAIKDLTDLV